MQSAQLTALRVTVEAGVARVVIDHPRSSIGPSAPLCGFCPAARADRPPRGAALTLVWNASCSVLRPCTKSPGS